MDSNILKDINLFKNINTVILDNLNNIYTNIMNNNNLSIFAMNIRSIRLLFDELMLLLNTNSLNFDIVVLTETWLDYDFKFVLNGYQTISIGKLIKVTELLFLLKNLLISLLLKKMLYQIVFELKYHLNISIIIL